jgi:hypothetical protein
MIKSDQINELATALAKAQGIMEAAKESATNPHFRSTYADLADDWDAVRKPLSDNGLSVSQLIDYDERGPNLTTILMHTSGQFISGKHPIIAVKNDPQGFKSAVTYARRTALESIVGLSTVEDDDGNEAQKCANKTAQKQPDQPSKPTQTNTQAKPPVVAKSNGEKPKCQLCQGDMIISKAGNGYYCPNFRDNNGDHSRFKKEDLEKYLAEQALTSAQAFMREEEVPF